MESEIETNSYEPNRIIKEFEKRAKEHELSGKNLIPSKTTRLIEKFEKKAQGLDDSKKNQAANSMVNNIRKVFEPFAGNGTDDGDEDTPDRVIASGTANKLIGMFQQHADQQQKAT